MSTESGYPTKNVPEDLVQAALRASRDRGVPVADVPVIAIAEEAGVSRSTLMRRLGGARHALDEAVRETGVDPGGKKPVRQRAAEAAGALISEHGLAAVTLERVADHAHCSVHSLYAAFGGRDELLHAVYERYSPVLDVEAVLAGPHEDLAHTVRRIHSLMAEALNREPRVLPAMLADALSRPHDPAAQSIYQHALPRMLGGVGQWLTDEATAGRIRPLPPLLLMQQLAGPLITHFLMRPAAYLTGTELPTTEEVIDFFTQTFLRAVAHTTSPPQT